MDNTLKMLREAVGEVAVDTRVPVELYTKLDDIYLDIKETIENYIKEEDSIDMKEDYKRLNRMHESGGI